MAAMHGNPRGGSPLMFARNDSEFSALIHVVGEEQRLVPSLIEKITW